jgi:hypothetical protein
MTLMEAIDTIAQHLLEGLEKVELYSHIDYLSEYGRRNENILPYLLSNGVIGMDEILEILENKVREVAWRCYYDTTIPHPILGTIPPDHVFDPRYITFGMENGVFSEEEIDKIPFDQGETPEKFSISYPSERLMSELNQRLLHPKPEEPSRSFTHDCGYGDGPCCACPDD